MTPPRSTSSFARFASRGLALALVLASGAALRDDRAEACGWPDPTIAERTTFDPTLIDDATWEGLYFDPFVTGFGGACADCAVNAAVADWRAFLGGAVSDPDWRKVLLQASVAELGELAQHATGKRSTPPAGYDRSTLWKVPPGSRDKLVAALAVVSLARRVEAHAAFDVVDAQGRTRTAPKPPAALLGDALAGMKAARDPFLAQRYAFQALRVAFYLRDWPRVIALFEKSGAVFAGPSTDLAWRARYYFAGALARDRKRGRSNLELARIHAGYPALAGAAVGDFQPMEDADWRESLRLARDPRERTLLWRLVGVKQDGIVAIREIAKLDPKSNLIALLVVRELARIEGQNVSRPVAGAALAAQRKAFAVLEPLVVAQASTPGADRPWLMELVAAHISAKRGDVATTKARIQRALAAKKGDRAMVMQAKASLALALVMGGALDAAGELELATTMMDLDRKYARYDTVRSEVRGTLAAAFEKAGKLVEAELLRPGVVTVTTPGPNGKPAWQDTAFLRALIARAGKTSTAFDAFVLDGSYTKPALEQELALRQLAEGDFAGAAKTFTSTTATTDKLGTDPFAMPIVDCHDCDHATYANAGWTHANVALRLADLERAAKGTGEPAAQASLALGNALYNFTWYGNARTMFGGSHQETRDTQSALRWYKRAFDLTRDRELKTKAAYFAAKAELAAAVTVAEEKGTTLRSLPVAATWFPILQKQAGSRYYREVLRECGHFRSWTQQRP